jgi:hypothetical protein
MQQFDAVEQRMRGLADVGASFGAEFESVIRSQTPAADQAGDAFGASFRSGLRSEIEGARDDTIRTVRQIIDALTFTARPSVEGSPAGGTAATRSASATDTVRTAMRPTYSDYGVGEIV